MLRFVFCARECQKTWAAGSCLCCRAKFEAGETYDCENKGRILPLAWQFVTSSIAKFLAASRGWSRETFGGSEVFFQSLLGCCRAVHARTMLKFHFLDEIPVMLVRLGCEENIGPRAIQQFDAVPEERHNKVSIEVLSRAAPTRQQILDMPNAWTLTPQLSLIRQRIAMQNVLDKHAEGPHALFKNVSQASRRSEFPWCAATVRLEQNIQDAEDIPNAINYPLQRAWNLHKSVLQTDKHSDRNVRCKFRTFCKRVYNLGLTFDPDSSESSSEDPCKAANQIMK